MARLYANENFPLPVVQELRWFGHDVLTTWESGRAGLAIPDDEVLAFAIEERRILLTIYRKHFIRLHGEVSYHFGIIVCTFDIDYTALAQRIDEALRTQDTMTSILFRINRP